MPLQFVNGQWIDSMTGKPVNTLMGGPAGDYAGGVNRANAGAPGAGGGGGGAGMPGLEDERLYGSRFFDPSFLNTPEGRRQYEEKRNPQEVNDPGAIPTPQPAVRPPTPPPMPGVGPSVNPNMNTPSVMAPVPGRAVGAGMGMIEAMGGATRRRTQMRQPSTGGAMGSRMAGGAMRTGSFGGGRGGLI